jgi:hypothetical protein
MSLPLDRWSDAWDETGQVLLRKKHDVTSLDEDEGTIM